MTEGSEPAGSTEGHSRRRFLVGGGVAGLGAVAAIGGGYLLDGRPEERGDSGGANGARRTLFHGSHQAGIATPAQAHAVFLGLDLLDRVGPDQLRQLMELLSDDAARLTQGERALADTEPELAENPSGLTVTFGFGAELVRRTGATVPEWLRPLPAFSIDRLEAGFSDGDLLIQVAADDPIVVAHASRMLLKDARSFTSLRWTQGGFRRAHGSAPSGTAMRNLFGQVDETANPQPDTAEFDRVVWSADDWLNGGTSLVLRRVHMNLDTWDELDRPGRELAVGRFLSNGAPLTGREERDEPDFDAVTPIGFPVIPEFSHVRRARPDEPDVRIFRRSYNYDDAPVGAEISNSGLLFASFQADVDRQFVPIQRRLDELDLLNQWTTPIGSSVFAIPPGCQPGGFVGETILV